MKIDQSLTIFVAVAGGIALGAALAMGTRRNRQEQRLAQKRQHKVDLHQWEGEGGNLAPTPAPVVAAL
jgi:transposase